MDLSYLKNSEKVLAWGILVGCLCTKGSLTEKSGLSYLDVYVTLLRPRRPLLAWSSAQSEASCPRKGHPVTGFWRLTRQGQYEIYPVKPGKASSWGQRQDQFNFNSGFLLGGGSSGAALCLLPASGLASGETWQ